MYTYPSLTRHSRFARVWEPVSLYRMPVPLYAILVVLMLGTITLEYSFSSEIRVFSGLFYVLGTLAYFVYGGVLRRSPSTWLILGAILVPMISWAFMQLDHPEMARDELRLEGVLNKFVFIIPAFLLAGSARNTLVLWSLSALAVLLLPWIQGDGMSEITRALSGRRTGFGSNPIRMGMIYGTLFIGLVVFFRRLVWRPDFSWWRCLPVSLITLYAGAATMVTQTRGVYVSLLAVLIVVAVYVIYRLVKRPENGRAFRPGYLAGGVLVLLALAGTGYQTNAFQSVIDKTSREMVAVEAVLSGDIESVPRSSIGLRFHFWSEALAWSAERPIVGWGYRASRVLHEQAGNRFGDRYFHTIHNAYLDVLLSYGTLGLILFSGLVVWLVHGVIKAWRSGVMPTDFAVFSGLFAVFYSVNSLFTSSLFITDSIYLFNVILGGIATFVMRWYIKAFEAKKKRKRVTV